MSDLKRIQEEFLESIVTRDITNLEWAISSDNAHERFKTYSDTVYNALSECLMVTYPGVWELLGKECADSVANAYCSQFKNLPNSGNLEEWGRDFPEFLASLKPLSSLPYLPDYATYEWKRNQVYKSKRPPVADYSQLQDIDEESVAKVRLELIPARALFSSKFPVDKIHEVIASNESQNIELPSRGSCALLASPEDRVVTYWLEEDMWDFIKIINDNPMSDLGKCYEKLTQKYSEFDLTKALYFMFSNQLIYKIHK